MRNVIHKNLLNALVVNCPQHGQSPWVGMIACSDCGRVFQMLSPKVWDFAPAQCPCGARLLPRARGATAGTAVWICLQCWVSGLRTGGRLARLSNEVAVIMSGHETKAR